MFSSDYISEAAAGCYAVTVKVNTAYAPLHNLGYDVFYVYEPSMPHL